MFWWGVGSYEPTLELSLPESSKGIARMRCDEGEKKNLTETNCIVRTLRVPTGCNEWMRRMGWTRFPRIRPFKVQCVRSATSAKWGLGESQRDSAKARPSQLWEKCDWFHVRRASQLLIRISLTPVEGTFAAACYGNGKRRRRQDSRGVAAGTMENVCPTRIAPLAAIIATFGGRKAMALVVSSSRKNKWLTHNK